MTTTTDQDVGTTPVRRPTTSSGASRQSGRRQVSRRQPSTATWLSTGDRGYRGLLAKNPLHPLWGVEWRRDAPYSLEDLGGSLSKEDMRPDAERASFGLGTKPLKLTGSLRRSAASQDRPLRRLTMRRKSRTACIERLGQLRRGGI